MAERIAGLDFETVRWMKAMVSEHVPKSSGEQADLMTSFLNHRLGTR